jgi:hypothetical protein
MLLNYNCRIPINKKIMDYCKNATNESIKKVQERYKSQLINKDLKIENYTPILIQYAPFGGRNEWFGPVTLRIYDAKRCKQELINYKPIIPFLFLSFGGSFLYSIFRSSLFNKNDK